MFLKNLTAEKIARIVFLIIIGVIFIIGFGEVMSSVSQLKNTFLKFIISIIVWISFFAILIGHFDDTGKEKLKEILTEMKKRDDEWNALSFRIEKQSEIEEKVSPDDLDKNFEYIAEVYEKREKRMDEYQHFRSIDEELKEINNKHA